MSLNHSRQPSQLVRTCVRAVALGAACAIAATPAISQDARTASATDVDTLTEVVVTAQFRRENVQDTPIAVTAVTAEMLEQRGQTSIVNLADQAPNVTLKSEAGAWGPSLAASIRGVGQFDPSPALEPGVGIYVDDVYYPTISGSVLDLLDLDRVEVLRGPQGTLAGKNSIGGAIKLYSKQPGGEGGYFEADYGSRNLVAARGAADFALAPGTLFLRISGATRHQDGYVKREDYACTHPGSGLPTFATGDGCLLGTEGGAGYTGVRASLRWLPSEKFEMSLIADYTEDDAPGGPITLAYANSTNPDFAVNGVPYDSRFIPTNPYVSYATFHIAGTPVGGVPTSPFAAADRNLVKGWGVSDQFHWQLSDTLALTSITAWRGGQSQWSADNDVSPLSLGLGTDNLKHNHFSQELRLNGSIGKPIDYTIGAFYMKEDSVYAARADDLFIAAIYDFYTDDPIDASTRAAFAHAVWHVSDRLNVSAGVRDTKEVKDYTYSRLSPDGQPNAALGALNGSTGHYDGSHKDYRLDVDYHWTDAVMTYAQYSTGFKGGGVNPTPLFVTQVQPFGPETLDAFEVGLKSTLFDHRMLLNLAAFFMKYDNVQLTLLNCPQFSPPGLGAACAMPQNAGDAHVQGAEVETEIHPFGKLAIDASVSYLDFKYTTISEQAGGPALPGGVQFGMVPPFTPKWKGSLGFQYEFNLPAGTLTPRVDGAYQDRMYSNAVNSPKTLLDGYTLINARLTWRSPGREWEAALEGRNLNDKLYYVTNADLSGLGIIWQEPGEPRTWAFSIKRRF